MKERIKKIRKELDLTQQEFADRLHIKRNTVASYETGKSNLSDGAISLVCREFNVNEEWLRTGEGEMFRAAPSDVLDQLASEYNLSNASYIVIEKFVNLKPEKRNELIDFFLEVSKAIIESEADPNAPATPDDFVSRFSEDSVIQAFNTGVPKTPEELEKKFPPVEPPKKSNAG